METLKKLDAASSELAKTKQAVDETFERAYRLIDEPETSPEPLKTEQVYVKLRRSLTPRGFRLMERPQH